MILSSDLDNLYVQFFYQNHSFWNFFHYLGSAILNFTHPTSYLYLTTPKISRYKFYAKLLVLERKFLPLQSSNDPHWPSSKKKNANSSPNIIHDITLLITSCYTDCLLEILKTKTTNRYREKNKLCSLILNLFHILFIKKLKKKQFDLD